MSSRVLRKLAGDDDALKPPADDDDGQDDSGPSRGARPKRAGAHKNPFQLVREVIVRHVMFLASCNARFCL